MVSLQTQSCFVGKECKKTLLSLRKHVFEEKKKEKMIPTSVIGKWWVISWIKERSACCSLVMCLFVWVWEWGYPLPTRPPSSPSFQINALCRLSVADSYQWAISIQASLTVCLRPTMWPAMSYGAPSCSVIPQSLSVCSRLPYAHTHKHTQTDKDTSHLILRRSETTLVFFRRLPVWCAHRRLRRVHKCVFTFRVGSLRLCVYALVRLFVRARTSFIQSQQLLFCGASESLTAINKCLSGYGEPRQMTCLPVNDYIYTQSLIELRSKLALFV